MHKILLLTLAAPLLLFAQDTRQVTEPKIPAACTTLTAQLAAPGGVLSDADEQRLDTVPIQRAIDGCAAGQAVELKPGGGKNIFLSGPLKLKPGVTLVIDAKTALFASRNPRDFDVAPGSCGIVGERGKGCQPLLLADHAAGAGIMGDGAIDGRGGATLIGQKETWWDLAHIAKVKDQNQACPRILIIRQSDNFTLYRITMRNSPNFHVVAERTNGFTAWGVKIQTPKTARNTDGIDPSSSTNVTITHCDISTGDDNVAIKSGNMGPAAHMTITHNHFYHGHGMSIGSGTNGGVSDIHVEDLSIDGADNGLRIKSDRSRGGLVHNVSYENVCLRGVTNPILLTPLYTTFSGSLLPIYQDIRFKDVHSVTSGYFILAGLDEQHKLDVTFDNVTVDGVKPTDIHARDAAIKVGPRMGNFLPEGPDVSVMKDGASAATPLSCADRFQPFPALPDAPRAKVVEQPEDKTLYVAADGTGDFYSIQWAIDVAPAEGAVINVAPGEYRERLVITKPHITLHGPDEDPKKTIIVNDQSAKTTGSTFKSAAVEVRGDYFTAENLTIANDWNARHAQEFQGSQALAVLATGDHGLFRNVRLLGNQDTLYAGGLFCKGCATARQLYTHCYIEGNVDFIFGDANAYFDHCEIHNTAHNGGYITAQGKADAKQDSTFVFNHCTLTAEPGVKTVFLGRPWRPYASVVFLNTEMGAHLAPAGWRDWHPGETHYLDTVFYAEYNSKGPGADMDLRDEHTKKLTAAEAAKYELKPFLSGADHWDPLH